jgi:exopolysaccharide production protein ExoZ
LPGAPAHPNLASLAARGSRTIEQKLSIQYLRGVAAILVVIYHATVTAAPDRTFSHGIFGVDIFFVISGFIMWAITAAAPTTPVAFLRQRIVRIVPLYWALTLVAAFVAFRPDFRLDFNIDYEWLLHSLFFIASASGEFEVKEMAAFPILPVGWTLNFEMMFYALFAIALFLRPAMRLAAIVGALTILVLTGAFVYDAAGPVLQFYTGSISIEFAFGVLLGWAFMRCRSRGISWNAPVSGAVLIAAAWLIYRYDLRLLDARGIGAGLPALAICAGALMMEPWLSKRPVRMFKLLGDASYSIYLSHLSALTIGAKLFSSIPFSFPQAVKAALLVVIAVMAGVTVYKLIEQPVTARLRRALNVRPRAETPGKLPLRPADSRVTSSGKPE